MVRRAVGPGASRGGRAAVRTGATTAVRAIQSIPADRTDGGSRTGQANGLPHRQARSRPVHHRTWPEAAQGQLAALCARGEQAPGRQALRSGDREAGGSAGEAEREVARVVAKKCPSPLAGGGDTYWSYSTSISVGIGGASAG